MASQDITYKAGELKGHAQVKKDEIVDRASDACQGSREQAGGFLQQTGEQVKNAAQGAADAVKNTLGIGSNNNGYNNTTTCRQ